MEVGVVLFRQLPVDTLDRLRRGVLLHAEYLVVVPHGMRTIAYPLLFERVLPPHSPGQLGVSPSRPRRPGCTPCAASGRPCGVTRTHSAFLTLRKQRPSMYDGIMSEAPQHTNRLIH